MDTLEVLSKSFDKLFVTTAQNISVCKWSFIFTSIGVGLSMLINSFYLIKINNENNSIKNKLNLLLNNQKLIIEGNITIYDFIKNTDVINNNNKNTQLQLKNNEEKEDFDFLYCN